MSAAKTTEQYIQEAEIMYRQHFQTQIIEEHLEKEGADDATIRAVRKHLYKLIHARRRKSGSIFVGIGVVLLGLGFLSSFGLFYSGGEINYALYGFTIAGISVLFFGLVQIFE